MNCLASPFARSAAASGWAASADETSKIGPNTSFRATKAAAMPQLVRRNWRRSIPSLRALASERSLSRSSKRRWRCVCGRGLNSPFDTMRVGTGDLKSSLSAGSVCASSRLLRKIPMPLLPWYAWAKHRRTVAAAHKERSFLPDCDNTHPRQNRRQGGAGQDVIAKAIVCAAGQPWSPSPFDLYAYEEGIDLPEIVSWGGRSDLTSSVADDLLSLWDRGSGPRGREEPCWHALMPPRRVEFGDNAQDRHLAELDAH